MKHLSSLILIVLIVLVARPAFAQDATQDAAPVAIVTQEAAGNTAVEDGGTVINIESPAETLAPVQAESPLTYAVMIFAAIVLFGVTVFSRQIISKVAVLIPPEAAQMILESGIKIGVQIALDKAAETPNELDDEFFIKWAKDRGIDVIKTPEGGYVVRSKPAMPPTETGHISGVDIAKGWTTTASKFDVSPLANNPTITNIHAAGGESIGGDAEFR